MSNSQFPSTDYRLAFLPNLFKNDFTDVASCCGPIFSIFNKITAYRPHVGIHGGENSQNCGPFPEIRRLLQAPSLVFLWLRGIVFHTLGLKRSHTVLPIHKRAAAKFVLTWPQIVSLHRRVGKNIPHEMHFTASTNK